ncbi:MAG TPA: hypothetical protein PK967_00035 [Candidatus Hydrogenedentes bacterium]|nr:hypothetical protein [Candidatus Hydrogenedentota bacterium]
MSETVRSFTGSDQAPRIRGTRARHGRERNLALGIVMVLVLYGCWATRDNAPMEQFIPANQAFHLFANDIQAKREAIAASDLWKILPPQLGGGTLAARIGQDVGMPDWILRNLVPDMVYVSGTDTDKWTDAIVVSRMTRIGCVLNKCRRWVPGIDEDYAGGLRMAHVRNAGLHFAVRGRTLLAGRSRDALIRALTLRPDEALKKKALANKANGDEAGDIHGAVTFAGACPPGKVLKGVSFVLRIEKTHARIKCRAALVDTWKERLGQAIGTAGPVELIMPPDGAIQLSLNLGRPVGECGTSVLAALGLRDQFDARWSRFRDAAPMLAQVSEGLIGHLGPGVRLAWQGMDLNEMAPMPKLLFSMDASPDAILRTYANLPPFPPPVPGDMIPHYNSEKRMVHLSLIGGPSMEPAAAIAGSSLLLSNCRPLIENLVENPPKEDKLPQQGNLYIRVQPKNTVEAVSELAILLAENHLLKDLSPEQVRQFFDPWLANLAHVREIVATMAIQSGEISLDLAANTEAGK